MTGPNRSLILTAILLAAATLAVADGELRFVQAGETTDLSELRDGERREFGDGEHRIVAERSGDIVHITRAPGNDGRQIDLSCDVSTDTCQVMTGSDDEHVMIRVEKRRVCEGDDCGTLDVDVHAIGAGGAGEMRVLVDDVKGVHGVPGAHVRKMIISRDDCDGDDCENTWVAGDGDAQIVIERVRCVDDGDGEKCETFNWTGAPGDQPMSHGADGASMVFIGDDGTETVLGADNVVLHCPKGDAHLRVELAEADDTFLCPKHSVPMERTAGTHHAPHGAKKRVMIKRGDR